jgi:hypothetical protein
MILHWRNSWPQALPVKTGLMLDRLLMATRNRRTGIAESVLNLT